MKKQNRPQIKPKNFNFIPDKETDEMFKEEE